MCVKRSLLNNTSFNVSLESILARSLFSSLTQPFPQNENPIFILYLKATETVASNNVMSSLGPGKAF